MKALCIMNEEYVPLMLDSKSRNRISELTGEELVFMTYAQVMANPQILKDVEYLFPSYGMGCMDEKFMSYAEKLQGVFFLGGSIKTIVSRTFWDRNIPITCAAVENAIPVAEFVLGQILLHLKGFFYHCDSYKTNHDYQIYIDKVAGVYNKKIGLISYGTIAKHLKKLLENFNLEICVYSPELNVESAKKEGMTFMSLKEIFKECDVVSLHTPLLPATVGMIDYELLSNMKPNSAFINSARGPIVNEKEMIKVLTERPDITAFIDVTEEMPIEDNNELYKLKNVFLTPHIAGATGYEKARLGKLIVEEFERFLNGEQLRYSVDERILSSIA